MKNMEKIIYPDEVNTPREKIAYIMDVYGIKDENANLLKDVIKDIAVSLAKSSYYGWIEDAYDEQFLDDESLNQ